jgi:dipeptidyl aminopeptidase/acylaminoacyl peptidase
MMATQWADDADAAVTWAGAQSSVDPKKLGFTGCSLGGVMALYAAAHDSRVRSVVEMSAFSDGRSLLEEAWTMRCGAPAWREFLGDLEADAARVAQGGSSRMMRVPDALAMRAEDREEYLGDRLGKPGIVVDVPLESVRSALLNFRSVLWLDKIEIPVMVMHGTADEIVFPRHARIIHDALRCRKELVMIPDGPHPLPACDGKAAVFAHMVRWFSQTLTGG